MTRALGWIATFTLLAACEGKSSPSPSKAPANAPTASGAPAVPAAVTAALADAGLGVLQAVDEDQLFNDMADVADKMATALLSDTGNCGETAKKLAALVPAQQAITARAKALRATSSQDDLARLRARGEADPRLKLADRKEALDKKTSELATRCRDDKAFQDALKQLGLKIYDPATSGDAPGTSGGSTTKGVKSSSPR